MNMRIGVEKLAQSRSFHVKVDSHRAILSPTQTSARMRYWAVILVHGSQFYQVMLFGIIDQAIDVIVGH